MVMCLTFLCVVVVVVLFVVCILSRGIRLPRHDAVGGQGGTSVGTKRFDAKPQNGDGHVGRGGCRDECFEG